MNVDKEVIMRMTVVIDDGGKVFDFQILLLPELYFYTCIVSGTLQFY